MYKLVCNLKPGAHATYRGHLLERVELIENIKERFYKIKLDEEVIIHELNNKEGITITEHMPPVKKEPKKEIKPKTIKPKDTE